MTLNQFQAIDQRMVGDIYTSREVMDNLAILCDEFGSRFGGTPGELQAAEFMAERLKSYGLTEVRLEPFEYHGWRRGTVELEILAPVSRRLPCISLPQSPAADLTAELVDMGAGVPEHFSERAADIAGKIVLVNSEINPGNSQRWIHRSEKYGRSLMAGAVGFIFVNHYPGYGPATGGIGHDGPGLIPGISLAYEDGAYLQRLVKRHGSVKIRIASTDHNQKMTSWNVLGELTGTVTKPETVMLGCHYDGHDISQGAGDPASGTVAVLEAARVLAKHAGRQPHTIGVALWGVEEIGLLGSREYVQAHAATLASLRFYLNLDSAGVGSNKGLVLNEWSELAPLFEAWLAETGLDYEVGQSLMAFSDHFPFFLAGVPTGGIEPVKRDLAGRGYGHTHYDTLDKVTLRGLREAADLAARLALRVANETAWPAEQRAAEDVQALLSGPTYQADADFRAAIDAFYAQAR